MVVDKIKKNKYDYRYENRLVNYLGIVIDTSMEVPYATMKERAKMARLA